MSSTTTTGDVGVAQNLYNLVISQLKKASLVCPPVIAAPFFNLKVYLECPNGTNARGNSFYFIFLLSPSSL
jgi:hypothetical protein